MGYLRVLLALAVITDHAGPLFGFRFTGGMVAVQTFFIISGFYMAMILESKYTGKGAYRLFLTNRFLRLYPMYWVVLAATFAGSILAICGYGFWNKLAMYQQYLSAMELKTLAFQILVNLGLFGQDLVMFLGLDKQTGGMFFTHFFWDTNPHFYKFLLVHQAWTLGVELLFYVVAPFLVKGKNKTLFVLIGLSLGLRLFIYHALGWDHDPWLYRFFPTELALFLFGIMAYRFYLYIDQNPIWQARQTKIVTVFALLVVFYQFLPGGGERNWIFYGITTFCLPFVFRMTKNSRKINRIGELSYPVYIVHVLVLNTLAPHLDRLGLSSATCPLTVIVSILCAYGMVRGIADPVERFRVRRVRRARVLAE